MNIVLKVVVPHLLVRVFCVPGRVEVLDCLVPEFFSSLLLPAGITMPFVPISKFSNILPSIQDKTITRFKVFQKQSGSYFFDCQEYPVASIGMAN